MLSLNRSEAYEIICSPLTELAIKKRLDLKWMRDNKLRYRTMAEIERNGFEKVLERVYAELKCKKLFVSVDMDRIDLAYAPAVGTQEADGLTVVQALCLLCGVAMQNEAATVEFNEYNPLLDDPHRTTGILMDRLMRSFLTGVAARKKGITVPNYYTPDALDHGNRE